MGRVRAILAVAGLALIASVTAACVESLPRGTATPTTGPQPTATATAQASPTQAATATATMAAATPSPTSGPAPSATPTPDTTTVSNTGVQRYGLFIELEGVSPDSIVYGTNITVSGLTAPDAVLSIQGVIVPVEADGSFSYPVVLDAGPNIIEVVASDLAGNVISQQIAVVSLPEQGTAS